MTTGSTANCGSLAIAGDGVLEGSTCYYRVQVTVADVASALSDEVSGTPLLSITGNQLNDVAWNGVDVMVAVGDSGVILASASGTVDPWLDVSPGDAPQQLTGVTRVDGGDAPGYFVILGNDGTVITSRYE